ncbi:MAG: bifunctional phosphoglucose/phosphomannose isomerase [Luteibaculaceae bacterium]
MRNLILDFPHQIIRTVASVEQQKFIAYNKTFKNIMIAGMGGSGIAGKVLINVFSNEFKVPVLTVNSYDLPAFVNEDTLFIACSYSGNTEETLLTLQKAEEQKASIIGITSGGELQTLCKKNSWPCLTVEPGKPPRTQFGSAITALLFSLVKHGLLVDKHFDNLTHIADNLIHKTEELEDNAAVIAHEMVDNIPVIYASKPFESVALRFRQQLNENSKMLCWHAVLPEMNHNEIVGWELADEFLKAIVIRDRSNESKAMQTRFEVTQDIISDLTDIIEVRPEGDSQLEKVLYLIYYLDWVSFHLAELNHIDPTAIKHIDRLKEELSKNK